MKLLPLIMILPIIGVAACSESPSEPGTPPNNGGPAHSAFLTPAANGGFGLTLIDPRTVRHTDAAGIGYALVIGKNGNQYVGYVGLLPGTSLTASPPSAGGVLLSGTYTLREFNNIVQSGNTATANDDESSGVIALVADFGAGTVTGATAGSNPELTVNGTFSGSTLSGTVTHAGLEGQLVGAINADEAIGTFHGHNDTMVYVGGFIALSP
ncbi:MAG: hypothetical protein V3V13_10475 [Paracoccaceae bacterium]